MTDGSGLGNIYPAFKDSDYLSTRISLLPCLISKGKAGTKINTINMPANQTLSRAELNNLMNYMSTTWGNKKEITIKELKIMKEKC